MPHGREDFVSAARAQLAIDLNCAETDFDREGAVVCEAKPNPGRRLYPRGTSHYELASLGGAAVVSATPDLLPGLRARLEGRTRGEAFAAARGSGCLLFFLPGSFRTVDPPEGFRFQTVEYGGMGELYGRCDRVSCGRALNFGPERLSRPDVLAVLAMAGSAMAGLAGASADCGLDSGRLWQIGIDVMPGFRRRGLATALVGRLAALILERGKIPFYGTSADNLASQKVALRAGFWPAWASAYGDRDDGPAWTARD